MARERARTITDLRYDLSLSIPAQKDQAVTGRNVVRFKVSTADQPLVLDFDPERPQPVTISSNGQSMQTRPVNGHLVIPPERLVPGENVIEIDFTAGDGPLHRGDDLLFTVFVPAYARRAIPCFDQPDLKGRWTLTLEHPAAWQSVANGREAARQSTGERARVRFDETPPLPTYLVAFTVGAMQVDTAVRDGRTMRIFHREADAAKFARNRDAIFDLHERALDFMARYTGIDHPFAKLDIVLVPTFPFPAMEHAGSIAYDADAVLLDESATRSDEFARAQVIAHEVAHAWFGNLVTMRWFDDVWTKEVFANFMAAKIAQPLFPEIHHDLAFFLAHQPGAYTVDRSPGTHPIRQPLDNLLDAASLYGPIIYQKAPVVMRQLEAMLGEENFRDGLRDYLRRHAFANATWDDLIAALAPRAKFDLPQWSRVWIDEAGRPSIRTELSSHGQRVEHLRLREIDPQQRGRHWPQRLQVGLLCEGLMRRVAVDLEQTAVDLTSDLDGCVPQAVLAGSGAWGYGEFQLDARTVDTLMAELGRLADPLDRAVAWSALWDETLAGRLAPMRLLATALDALRREPDELVATRLLRDFRSLWWLFLQPAQRRAAAPDLETLLQQRLGAAATPSQRGIWLRGLRTLGITPDTTAWLRALWQRDIALPGLTLGESDETALAVALALRDAPDASAVLDAQAARIESPDRRAQFDFVRGALSSDAAQRERWFRRLADPANRRPEPWVIEGMGYLHHALRAGASEPLIEPALQMLLDVRQHGGAFFDWGWLDALLDGYGSRSAALTVRRFVAGLPPGYPPSLRRQILQSSDLLMRAARWSPPAVTARPANARR
ncbi:MAG TPA: M1 family aminopeptidase [Burkholderiaceae bacterium]|nr:M1 family aminopeptidase [Burkholderiaceae bacterium]